VGAATSEAGGTHAPDLGVILAGVAMKVEHRLGYGQRPNPQGRPRFYAECSCGWKQPVRAKLTQVIGDLRTHSGEVVGQALEQGWRISRGQGLDVVIHQEQRATPKVDEVLRRSGGRA
jgi:hypothetical protein